jgi:RNA polymerase sigma-70 factor, ECF subfamily
MFTNGASVVGEFTQSQTTRSRPWIASNETSDSNLIGCIAAGDRAAMRIFYARHKSKGYRFALRLVGNEAAAEDAVSETFFDVWRHAGAFERRSQVSTWLLGIARNKALSIRRHGTMEAWDDDACESIADAADDPAAKLQRKQQGAVLFDCLQKLSPAHREIIDLVYYHEKTIDEIAGIIGISPNTVKTRMFYARQKLAELLGARGVTTALA